MSTIAARSLSVTPEDVYFEALSNERRRRALAVVAAADERVSLTDVAVELAAAAGEGDGVDPDAVKRVRRSLYHRDVPRLAAAGLVSYDPHHHLVAPTPPVRRAEDVTDLVTPSYP